MTDLAAEKSTNCDIGEFFLVPNYPSRSPESYLSGGERVNQVLTDV